MPSNVVKPRIEVAGTPLAPEIDTLVEQVVVDDSRTLPDMFVLRFRDPDHTVLHDGGADARRQGQGLRRARSAARPRSLLISGEVTALEAEIDETGTHAVARGYDVSHRLQRGRNTRTFVGHLGGRDRPAHRRPRRASISARSRTLRPRTRSSRRRTSRDYDFLRGRAREIGFDLAVRDDKLYFQPPVDSSTAPAAGTLAVRRRARSSCSARTSTRSCPRITAAEQVNAVEVRGWDPDDAADGARHRRRGHHERRRSRTARLAGAGGVGVLERVEVRGRRSPADHAGTRCSASPTRSPSRSARRSQRPTASPTAIRRCGRVRPSASPGSVARSRGATRSPRRGTCSAPAATDALHRLRPPGALAARAREQRRDVRRRVGGRRPDLRGRDRHRLEQRRSTRTWAASS